MGIQFPDVEEIKLKKPPISEVICQVRFPYNLRIEKELPVNFQEAIREIYPILEIDQSVIVQVNVYPAAEVPTIEKARKIYRFKTKNGKTSTSLAPDFFALTTEEYAGWQEFQERLTFITNIFNREFQPKFTTRVGLRFINQLNKENTDLLDFNDILKMLREELTCLIRTNQWSDMTEAYSQITLLDQTGKLVFRYGAGNEEGKPFFALDFDYFEEDQQDFDQFIKRLDHYHDVIYKTFRWCLKEESLQRFNAIKEKK